MALQPLLTYARLMDQMNSLETEYLQRLMTFLKDFMLLAATKSAEFSQAQAALGLEAIFLPQQLLNADARVASHYKLSQLQSQLQDYKTYYQMAVLTVNKNILACESNLTAEQQAVITQKVVQQLQAQLHEQHYFYSLRERWINAVSDLLQLFKQAEGQIEWRDETFLFIEDAHFEQFVALTETIDQAAALEHQLMQARQQRITSKMEALASI